MHPSQLILPSLHEVTITSGLDDSVVVVGKSARFEATRGFACWFLTVYDLDESHKVSMIQNPYL